MNLEEFKIMYARKYALASFPSINITATAPNFNINTNTSRFFSQQSTQSDEAIIIIDIPQLGSIYRTACCIFTLPFDNYLEKHQENTIKLELKKLVEEELTVSATTNTQMAVKEEASASSILLNKLI